MRKPLLLLCAAAAVLAVAPTAQAKPVKRAGYGLSQAGWLVKFDATNTSRARAIGRVRGLAAGERLVGIDFRPRGGELVGLGSRSGVYRVSTRTARARRKSSLTTMAGAPVALRGERFDIDFNPAADRLRVVSDQGQNLRANVDTGLTAIDGVLDYAEGSGHGGLATGISGVAYTSNDDDPATGTRLFGIDSRLDALVLHSPPNSGTLTTVGPVENAALTVGFDVYSRRDSGGRAVSDTAYVSNRIFTDATRLYRMSLSTGRLTRVRGGLGSFSRVSDIAIRP